MNGKANENIVNYMNALGHKKYSYLEVSSIAYSIKAEYNDRKKNNILINVKSRAGKQELNKRIAELVNNRMCTSYVTFEDIALYKRCRAEEYTERTGRCAYGFKEVRKRLGYDPITGYEID